jgi:hypothetical protein
MMRPQPLVHLLPQRLAFQDDDICVSRSSVRLGYLLCLVDISIWTAHDLHGRLTSVRRLDALCIFAAMASEHLHLDTGGDTLTFWFQTSRTSAMPRGIATSGRRKYVFGRMLVITSAHFDIMASPLA